MKMIKYALLTLFVLMGFNSLVNAQSRPNILIITVDDMNYNSCGVMGSPVKNITPNMDELAGRGLLFTRGYVSTSVCVPSRTSMMTACYPHRVSEWDGFGKPAINEKIPQSGYNIKKGTPTLTKALKYGGYVTGILAKPNHHLPYEEFPWDVIYGHHDYADLKHGRDADLYEKRTKEVINLAKSQNKPFFLLANAGDPHRPFPGSEAEKNAVKSGSYGGVMPLPSKTFGPNEVTVPGFLPDLPDIRKEVAEYYSGVRRGDDCVGSVLKALKESGLEDETIIFFLSDNGASFPFSKECCYMNGTRTPLMVSWKGHILPQSRDTTNFVSALDIAPTILDLLNMPAMNNIDGRSFKPLLFEKKQKKRDRIFTVYHFTPGHEPIPQRAVTCGDYTYIFNAFAAENKFFTCGDPRGGLTYKAMVQASKNSPEIKKRVDFYDYRTPEELYNDTTDPNSLNNLIDSPDSKNKIRRMRKMLARWMKAKNDPLLSYYLKYLN